MTCGIYKITNTINGKCYIGQSVHIERRWEEHKRNNRSLIAAALGKYGTKAFTFEILEECSPQELDEKEKSYIAQYNSIIPYGYNVETGGNSNRTSFIKYDAETLGFILDDIKNTDIPFDQIGEKYGLCRRTITRLNKGQSHFSTEESYPLRKSTLPPEPRYCEVCGERLPSHNDRFCSMKCWGLAQRKEERPSREELKELIRSLSFTTIAEIYNVSDNAIRKWCKAYSLPYKSTEIKKISDEDWESI